MEIIKSIKSGIFDITISGKFTFNDHPEFREILLQFENQEIHHVIIHLERLDFVDSAALGMLLLALDAAKKFQKTLVLSSPRGQVKKIFDMAGFTNLFTIN